MPPSLSRNTQDHRPVRLVAIIASSLRKKSKEEKELGLAISRIVNAKPINIKLYQLAMQHSSVARAHANGFKESNERLEYLGDAVLGMIVAEYLFKQYPFKDEGFLTEIRSRIVNRESLNQLAMKIGLADLIRFDRRTKQSQSQKSLYGDAMEAFIGAIYLDRGYRFTKKYVVLQLLQKHFDLTEVIENNLNFKSKIIEWSQKTNTDVRFEIINISKSKKHKQFQAQLVVNGEAIAEGFGFSKKKAEQDAARKGIAILEVQQMTSN